MKIGIAKNINRYCELIDEINSLNKNQIYNNLQMMFHHHKNYYVLFQVVEHLDRLQNEFLSIFAILHSQVKYHTNED